MQGININMLVGMWGWGLALAGIDGASGAAGNKATAGITNGFVTLYLHPRP